MADDPMDDTRSIAERAAAAANGAMEADEQLEAFPNGSVEGDAKITLRTLVKPGDSTSYTVSMRSAEVGLRGGLVDPRTTTRLLVTCEVAKVEEVAEREEGRVVGWKIRQTLRPTYVEPVGQMDGDLLVHYFRELAAASPQEGARVADQVKELAAEFLATV